MGRDVKKALADVEAAMSAVPIAIDTSVKTLWKNVLKQLEERISQQELRHNADLKSTLATSSFIDPSSKPLKGMETSLDKKLSEESNKNLELGNTLDSENKFRPR